MYTNEEEKLLAIFRRLSPAAKKELIIRAGVLVEAATVPAAQEPGDRCGIKTEPLRPEAAKEPLVTE